MGEQLGEKMSEQLGEMSDKIAYAKGLWDSFVKKTGRVEGDVKKLNEKDLDAEMQKRGFTGFDASDIRGYWNTFQGKRLHERDSDVSDELTKKQKQAVNINGDGVLLVIMKKIFDGDAKPIPLVSTFGHNFPLENRVYTQKLLWKWLKSHYAAWRFCKKDKKMHTLPVIAGCPGIGKSTVLEAAVQFMLTEAKLQRKRKWSKLVALLESAVDITVTYSNGASLDQTDVSLKPEASLALRILYRYFIEHPCGMSFLDFRVAIMDMVGKDFGAITLHSVLRSIREDKLAKGHTGELFVYIGVDEFTKLLGNGTGGNDTGFLRVVVERIGALLCDPPGGVFFTTLFAGTSFIPISHIIAGSAHPRLDIILPLLRLSHAEAVVRSLDWPASWQQSALFRRSLADVACWGRALECFLKCVQGMVKSSPILNFDALDYNAIMKETRSAIRQMYQVSTYVQYAKDIIAAVFLQTKVSHSTKLIWHDATWGELETIGAVALVPFVDKQRNDKFSDDESSDDESSSGKTSDDEYFGDESSDDESADDNGEDSDVCEADLDFPGVVNPSPSHSAYTVALPYILLQCILSVAACDDKISSVFKTVRPLLESTKGSHFLWQAWEDFHASYMATRAQLLVAQENLDHNQSLSTTIESLYEGAYMSQSIANLPHIMIPRRVSAVHIQVQFPNTLNPHDLVTGEIVDYSSGDVIIKNGKGGPCDVFSPWQVNAPVKNIYACDQLKKFEGGLQKPKITLAGIKEEFQKTRDAFSGGEQLTLGVFSDKPHDSSISPDKLPANCLLVCKQNFRTFYGNLFADRAAFAAAAEKICINTANWNQLQMLHGVGREIARKIVSSRRRHGPFISEADVKQRIPRIPKSIFGIISF